MSNNIKLLELLKRAGADFNIENDHGQTPLEYAPRGHYQEVYNVIKDYIDLPVLRKFKKAIEIDKPDEVGYTKPSSSIGSSGSNSSSSTAKLKTLAKAIDAGDIDCDVASRRFWRRSTANGW